MIEFINFIFNACAFTLAFALLYRFLKREPKQEIVELPEDIKFITIEQVEQSGTSYWLVHSYEQPIQFLAQGFSREEAIANTVARFPDKNIFEVV
jgi:hypothetical protein